MLASPRICELSADGLYWYQRYMTALTSGDAARLEPFLAETCTFSFNNLLPLHGRSTVALGISRYVSGVECMNVEFLNIYGTDSKFAAELLHHYARKDGASITIPAAGFVERNADGLVIAARAHVDVTPVFADVPRG